ncbi:MAG: hypothetical protein FJW31_01075 [Acidobacteria bacterium]|nr:hypothetical protein [Acidobacteriota bacterium]
MLDLFRSRDKSMRYLLIVLLSLVALSMVITLVPGFGGPSMGTGGNDDELAKVCGESITARQVGQLVAIQIRNREMSAEVAELAVPQIVNQLVGELATSCQAGKMGLTVSDAEVVNGIKASLPMLWQGGVFAGKDVYAGYLQRMQTSIPQFEQRVQQNILLEKLQRVAFDGIVVSPQEVQLEYIKRHEKARLEAVKFDMDDYRKKMAPSRAELEAHHSQNKNRYLLPATMTASILIADAALMGKDLAAPDAEIQKLYASNADRYTVKERVRARHILVKSAADASKDDDAKAKAKAQDLLNQIKGGGDFAELAKKNSDDPGSGAKGGDLDWFGRGAMVKPFEDSAFSLKVKEVSGLIKSDFGYHIIQTMAKEAARTKPFAEVKDELLAEYRGNQLSGKVVQAAEQARAELVRTPTQAEAVAKKYGLELRRVEKWAGGGDFPLLGKSRELDMAMAATPKGQVTEAQELPNNRLVFAIIEDQTLPRPGELNEVEDRVRATVMEEKAAKALEADANTLEAKLKANGNDLRKAAAEMGLKVIDTGEFERAAGGQIPNLSGAFFGEQPFINPVGQMVNKFRIGTTMYTWRVTERKSAQLTTLESERSMIVQQIRERKLRERRDLFEEGLVKQLKASGSISINEDAVKRTASTYRRG